jgi:hypothetical protein
VDNIFDRCPAKVEPHKISKKEPVSETTSFNNLKEDGALQSEPVYIIGKLRAY